jgi:hypothetical protein
VIKQKKIGGEIMNKNKNSKKPEKGNDSKGFHTLAEIKDGDAVYGVYILDGRLYTGRRLNGSRPFKSAIPLKIAKKLGLVK